MTLQLNGVNIIRGVGGAIVIERQELKRFFRMKKKKRKCICKLNKSQKKCLCNLLLFMWKENNKVEWIDWTSYTSKISIKNHVKTQ